MDNLSVVIISYASFSKFLGELGKTTISGSTPLANGVKQNEIEGTYGSKSYPSGQGRGGHFLQNNKNNSSSGYIPSNNGALAPLSSSNRRYG